MEDLKSSSCSSSSSSNICRSNESDLGESNSAAVTVNNQLTHHTGDSFLQNKKFLVIANVSKKPNMKTLIYSAAAHDFNVAIVGLPNMDISDLHLAEEITGTNHSDLMSRDGWRNNNNSSRSNCTNINQADSSSTGGEQENKESSNQQESGLCEPSSHRSSSESISSTLDNVTNNSSSTSSSSGSSSSSSSGSSSSSSRKVTTDNRDTFPSFQSGPNASNATAGATVKKNFCSILRFETLKELKSFLESKEIKLFGIEIMDEGKNYSPPLKDNTSFLYCIRFRLSSIDTLL